MAGKVDPHSEAVRGRGLMCAVELHGPARPICEALQQRGVLCKETHGTVIRLSPPLVVEQHDLAWAVEQLREVFSGLTIDNRLLRIERRGN